MKYFLQQHLKLLRQLLIPIFFLTLFSGTIDQIITLALEDELRSPEGVTAKIWYLASGSLANSLIFPWIANLLLLFSWKRQNTQTDSSWLLSYSEFAEKFASQSLIETLRAWGKCIVYSLLLIIPGLWKFLEYSFIPWIVCLHPSYDKGEIDALQTSTRFFRKVWVKMFFLMLLFVAIIPLVMTSLFEQYRLIWITPLPALGLHFIDTLIHILFFQCITLIFFRLLRAEDLHESHF
ncbi:MAG: hypothetical protein AABY64_00315 [Bdellovibrionota bacterium]